MSISYNAELSIPELTGSLIEAFRTLGGDAASNALQDFARSMSGQARDDFEALLTPLDASAKSLASAQGFLPLVRKGSPQVISAFSQVSDFMQRVHELGLGVTLSLIDERARAERSVHFDATIGAFCSALLDLKYRPPLTVCTLNYDNLLHSGFLDLEAQISDLADGRTHHRSRLIEGEFLDCLSLRRSEHQLYSTAVQIINLHGSLNWLTDPSTGDIHKFNIEDLRYAGPLAEGYWTMLANGDVDWLPAVILTDRKSGLIREWPFSLGYLILERRFAESEKWLIAGYSFGDVGVNEALQRAYENATHAGLGPTVLVMTHTNDPSGEADRISQILGVSKRRLLVDGQGLPSSLRGPAWNSWQS